LAAVEWHAVTIAEVLFTTMAPDLGLQSQMRGYKAFGIDANMHVPLPYTMMIIWNVRGETVDGEGGSEE